MARTQETVKVINHGKSAKSPLVGAVGLTVGIITGAGAALTAIRRRDNDEIDLRDPDANQSQAQAEPTRVGPFDNDAAGIDEPEEQKGPKAKLLQLSKRRRWRWLGRAMQVQSRYGELRGSNLAAAVTLQVFLSLFPLLLVAAAVAGFFVHNSDTDVVADIISTMGLTGAAAEAMRNALSTAADSRRTSSIIGLATLLWSALGVSAAIQYAYDQAWQVGDRGIRDKAVGTMWLAGAVLLFVLSAVVTTAVGWLPAGAGIATTVLGIVLSGVLWLFTAKVLPNVDVGWRSLLPGVVVGVIGLEVLKFLGGVWVPRAVESSSSLYGTIGVVFAVLAWLLLFGKLIVYSAIVNVVLYEGTHGVQRQTIEVPAAAVKQGNGVTRSGQSDTH